MPLSTPVRYSTDLEIIQPDEQETIQGLNETFDTNLEKTATD